MNHEQYENKKNKHRYSTYLLVLLIGIFTVVMFGEAALEGTNIWVRNTTSELVYFNHTNDSLCIGDTCWTNYQVSIQHNASINGSPICTVQNGLCNETGLGGGSTLINITDSAAGVTITGGAQFTSSIIQETTPGLINFTHPSTGQGNITFDHWMLDDVGIGLIDDGDGIVLHANVGGSNQFTLATDQAFFSLTANPGPSNGYLLASITETQGADTEINFYEGGTGHNRFWDSGSARFGGNESYLCSELTSDVDCDTASTGADVVIQDDLWVGDKIFASDWTDVSIAASQVFDIANNYMSRTSDTGQGEYILEAAVATNTPLTVKGFTTQTAKLQKWQDVNNITLLDIDKEGDITFYKNYLSFYNDSKQLLKITGDSSRTILSNFDRESLHLKTDHLQVAQTAISENAGIYVQPSATSDIGLLIKGASGQSANLQEWQDVSGNVLLAVDKDGYLYGENVTLNENLGINIVPEERLHVFGNTPRIWLEDSISGVHNVTQDHPGLLLTATTIGGPGLTSRYTPGVLFGSTDPQLTTRNPKITAAIVGRGAEAFSSDTKSAMAIDFFTLPNNAGADPDFNDEHRRMVIDRNGRVGIGNETTLTAQFTIQTNKDDLVGIKIQGQPGQVSDLQQWYNQTGDKITSIEPDGQIISELGIARGGYYFAYRNTTFTPSASNTYEDVDMDTIELMDTNYYSESAGVITVQQPGLYKIQYACTSDMIAGTREDSHCVIRVNGVNRDYFACSMYARETGRVGTSCSNEGIVDIGSSSTIVLRYRTNLITNAILGDSGITNHVANINIEYIGERQ